MKHGEFRGVSILARGAYVLALAFFVACANVVSPTGGPKDETPPVVVRSIPDNFSPNFSGGQIRIFFDEFVTLKDLQQQLLVSPPMEETPDIRVRGRSVVIEIEEELRPNTTYNVFFGNAIQDIAEGNALENFSYVFSTGDYVDSLSMGGVVVNAFTLKPEEGISVMLYDSIYDSIPYKERPVYFSRTGKEGTYAISNMRSGEYLLFALKDNNANYLYDLPDELIAFSDSLVSPVYVEPLIETLTSTLTSDSDSDSDSITASRDPSHTFGTSLSSDSDSISASRDPSHAFGSSLSSALTSTLTFQPPQHKLRLFQEADTVQRITSSSLVATGQVRMTFRVPYDSVCARDIGGNLPEDWYVPEFSRGRDTLTLWLKDVKADSLFMEMYDGIHLLDTITLSLIQRVAREREQRGAVARREGEDAPDDQVGRDTLQKATPVTIVQSVRSGTQWPHFRPFSAIASAPLHLIDTARIHVLMNDSIDIDAAFSISGPVGRTLVMDTPLEESHAYAITMFPGALTDMFGGVNDTIQLKIRTSSEDDFGMLIMQITLPTGPPMDYILQLLDKDGRFLTETMIAAAGVYNFPNLQAGMYGLRLIEDRNGNGVWDTGHYLKGVQPERVYMYPEPLQVRQGWESEESWVVEP